MPSDAVGVSISPSLSIYLSLSIFLSPSIYLSLSIYLCIYLSIHPAIYPSISPSTYLSIQLSIYLSVYLSLSLSISLPIYPSIHPSIHPSIYLSLSLSLQDPPNRGGRRHPGASPFYIYNPSLVRSLAIQRPGLLALQLSCGWRGRNEGFGKNPNRSSWLGNPLQIGNMFFFPWENQ